MARQHDRPRCTELSTISGQCWPRDIRLWIEILSVAAVEGRRYIPLVRLLLGEVLGCCARKASTMRRALVLGSQIEGLRSEASRTMGGLAFEIDENPSGQAGRARGRRAVRSGDRRVRVRANTDARRPAGRDRDLVVNKNRPYSPPMSGSTHRFARAPNGQSGHATWTQKYSKIKGATDYSGQVLEPRGIEEKDLSIGNTCRRGNHDRHTV